MDTKSLPCGNFPVDTKSSDPVKIIIKEEDDNVSLSGLRFYRTEEEPVEFHQRMEKWRNLVAPSFRRKRVCCLWPDRVKGLGVLKARGSNVPILSSNVKAGSANNRWETLQKHSPILGSIGNHQWQQYTNGYGDISFGGETSMKRHYPIMPLVHIDILSGKDQIDIEKGNNGHAALAYQGWKDYINQLKNSKTDDFAMKMMSGIFVAVAGQVVAGVMVNRLTSLASSSSSSSWAGPIVEVATVLGLCITLAGISLRAKSRPLSTLMIKLGAVIIAWAIIFSMGFHLPPAMAWTFGPMAFLIMTFAAAYA